MDYILFQSQYSPACKKLLHQFPNLREKSVSVDSSQMRSYIKKLHVVCVPTLVLIMGNKIIERIVGYESIQNWLLITIYRANQISQPPEPEEIIKPQVVQPVQPQNNPVQPQNNPVQPQNNPVQSVQSVQSVPVQEILPTTPVKQTTSLDQLILTDESDDNPVEDRHEPLVQTGSSTNTMQLAEALKKEREKSIDNKKKLPI